MPTNEQIPLIEVEDVNKSFGENQVLKKFNLNLYPNENVVVLGKSGSGKSVLIKCIIGLMNQDEGSIRVFGQEVSQFSIKELNIMRSKVGFLFQSNALYDSMTIRQNLEFPLKRHGIYKNKEEVDRLVLEALNNVGLTETVDMMPSELSGGMKKRIALARTLIVKPQIILYDEPTTGLDPVTGKEICYLMNELAKKYKTSSLIISHDIYCVKIVSQRIAILIDGMCYATGTYDDLKKSEDKKIRQFFD
jgi:phospholipid/cholesterol/gamma-HCH transport system ATP-binding protein